MPRRPETRFFCSKAAPLSSGRIVPIVTIAKGNSIFPTCGTKCQTLFCQSFHGYHGQHQCLHWNNTALAVRAWELHWHRCWTEEPGEPPWMGAKSVTTSNHLSTPVHVKHVGIFTLLEPGLNEYICKQVFHDLFNAGQVNLDWPISRRMFV